MKKLIAVVGLLFACGCSVSPVVIGRGLDEPGADGGPDALPPTSYRVELVVPVPPLTTGNVIARCNDGDTMIEGGCIGPFSPEVPLALRSQGATTDGAGWVCVAECVAGCSASDGCYTPSPKLTAFVECQGGAR